MTRPFTWCVLAAALWVAAGARAEDVLIRGATVYTESRQGTLGHGDVLLHDGSVAAIGVALAAPAGTTVIEAHGRPLTPGLFGGMSGVGLEDVAAEPQANDTTLDAQSPAWNEQWRPELDITLAYNPRSDFVPITRLEGVTWTMLAPGVGDTIVGGQGAAVSLDGRFDAVLPDSHFLLLDMGGDGARRAGGTRAAEFMLLDQAIAEAHGVAAGAGALLHPAGRDVLARYLKGGHVVFRVQRAADILAVLSFARRNGMNPVIWGGAEAWVVGRELAQAHVPVVLNPLEDLPKSFDRLGATLDNAARLARSGVLIAFSSDNTEFARTARQLAGNAVAHGLPWEAALAALTANPADVFGVGATRGRIEIGRRADLVLWSGDPLELASLPDRVWANGRDVPLRSRQTELRDRYLKRLAAGEAR